MHVGTAYSLRVTERSAVQNPLPDALFRARLEELMSAIKATKGQASGSPAEKPEPQPWLTAEDARGWRVTARGSRVASAPPLIRITALLDAEQSEWLRQESERTGLGYVEVVRGLIDEKRAVHTA
jgi:hypothetical protein